MDIIIVKELGNHLEQDINVVQQKINLQQDIGAVNILGQGVVVKEDAQKEEDVSVNFCNIFHTIL
tara:strand:+ start:201 stop:395 length:195 start_codon:yes stop_codon:yes gene_type:complete